MNPMTNMKNVLKLSAQELNRTFKTTWHDQYKDSAWIFIGGLPYDLTEGDVICIFSQYGEVVNINLIRDKITGKQKGFCFLCYEDQRSTVLAVDNLNGIKILGRTIRVDHVSDYKPPKDSNKIDPETKLLYSEGCGPPVEIIKVKSEEVEEQSNDIIIKQEDEVKKEKKHKKVKTSKKSKKKKKRRSSSSSSSDSN